jgi:hypothetical protein
VDRSKLGQLLRKQPEDQASRQSQPTELPALKPADTPLEIPADERYQPPEDLPPGEMVTLIQSISKITKPVISPSPWSVFWLVAVALTAGTSLLSVLLLMAVPPMPNCQSISLLSTDSERLYCAKLGAETNNRAKVLEAINLVKGWSELDPLHNDGSRLLNDWSRQLIRIVKRDLANGGNVAQAMADVRQIPEKSTVYKESQDLLQQWQEQWSDGKDITVEFAKAMQEEDWYTAYEYLGKVRSFKSAYWNRTQFQVMALELAKHKDAWDKHQEAERIAKRGERLAELYSNEPDNLVKAIAIAAEVPAKTYVKTYSQGQRGFWSRKLLALAAARYDAKDYGSAKDMAQKVPKDVAVYSAAQKLVNLSQAPTGTTLDNEDNLAKAHRLALAGTLPALQQAITLAQTVPQGQPLYSDAQQSITNWSATINHVTDRPIVDRARQLANTGDYAGAIALAKTIAPKRSLYRTAQSDITFWTRQEVVDKDRKVFKEAEALFLKDKVQEAIDLGSTLPKESTLYKPMQDYLKYWRSTQKPKTNTSPKP